MAKTALRKRRAVPALTNALSAKLLKLSAEFVGSSATKHTGTKGKFREDGLIKLMEQLLPSKYRVVSGEVVDLYNNSSPQLDLMIYDHTRTFSFHGEKEAILPAEALLASIEVKSRLTSEEVRKSLEAARKLRALKPFTNPLLGLAAKDTGNNAPGARYFHCLFAYDSDLTKDECLKKEAGRFKAANSSGEHLIDLVYVLDRGLINLNEMKGIQEASGAAVLTMCVSLLNFLNREGGRRADTPYLSYGKHIGGAWAKL